MDVEMSSKSMDTSIAATTSRPRRSSFFTKARMSFVRSGGDRGADIKTLRGTSGADFEGTAIVARGAGVDAGCCGFCLFGTHNRPEERIILVKGPFIFVYVNETDPSPLYAIALNNLRVEVIKKADGSSSSSSQSAVKTTVQLQSSLGDIQYEFILDNAEQAKNFAEAVRHQAAVGQVDQVRKQLGHDTLVQKRSSVLYAADIASKKIKDQPTKPVTTDEIISNMPMTVM